MHTSPLRWIRAALSACALGAASASFAQLTYTNNPAWDGHDAIGPLGESDNSGGAFGETFVADTTNTFMDSFTFQIWRFFGDGDAKFAGYVASWDGMKITNLLYTSSMRTITAPDPGFHAVTFNTGGLSLTAGAQYVAFVCAADFADGLVDVSYVGYTGDSFAGGKHVFSLVGNDFSLLSDQSWGIDDEYDLAFAMEFSPTAGGAVPEPSTYGMIGAMALIALIGIRRFRRA